MNVAAKLIKNKVGLLRLAEELGNVSQACKIFGYSRDSFYRYKELFDEGGEAALHEISRKKPLLKNRIEPQIENAVIAMATDNPAYGQLRASNELRKQGVFISPAGVRCVWLRHDLETFKKRLKALETKAGKEGLVLTEAQVIALERAKEEKNSTRRDRNASSRLPGSARHLLRRYHQRSRPDLPADFYRHLYQGCFRQAV